MKLNIADRLLIMNILPAQGSFMSMSLATEIRDKLTPPPQERQALGIAEDTPGKVTWNPEADTGKDIDLTQSETDLIVAELKSLDKQGKLPAAMVSVYRKFVLAPAAA